MNWRQSQYLDAKPDRFFPYVFVLYCWSVGDWLCQWIGMTRQPPFPCETHVPVTRMDVLTGSYFPAYIRNAQCLLHS